MSLTSDEPKTLSLRIQFVVRWALLLSIAICSQSGRGELVHFDFTGKFSGGASGTYSLFGVTVPRNAVVRGSFQYDTESQGVSIDEGTKAFHQELPGGFSLDVHNGAVRLSAGEYSVTGADDFGVAPADLDLFSVDFDSRWSPAPTPILVNDVPWSGPTAFMKVAFSWPSMTFIDADEPKLTTNRPLTSGFEVTAFVGSSGTPRMFGVETISIHAPEPDAMSVAWSGVLILAAARAFGVRTALNLL